MAAVLDQPRVQCQYRDDQDQQCSLDALENADLPAGDPWQTSPKGWGAAAQMPKAIADQRVWEHNRHRHRYRVARRLRSKTDDADIRRFFNSASALHENFYENTMDAFEVAEGLDDVEAMMDKLLPLLDQA